jgi:hypothetical protein
MPRNIFFSDLIRGGADSFPGFDSPKFSMSMTGWGTVAGEATYTVSGILETYNAATGGGNGNFGRYSNPSIDAKSVLAKQTIDRDARLVLLAGRDAHGDGGLRAHPPPLPGEQVGDEADPRAQPADQRAHARHGSDPRRVTALTAGEAKRRWPSSS